MRRQKFLSLPAGWGNALPGAILFSLLLAGVFILAQVFQSGRHALDLTFWIELGVGFPIVVVVVTVLAVRADADRDDND